MRHNTKSHHYNFQKDKKFHKKDNAYISIPFNKIEGDNSKMSVPLPRFKNVEDMQDFFKDSYITYRLIGYSNTPENRDYINQHPELFDIKFEFY